MRLERLLCVLLGCSQGNCDRFKGTLISTHLCTFSVSQSSGLVAMFVPQMHLEFIPHNCTVDMVETILAEVIW